MNKFLAIGSVSGFISVALGAFGAHALKERLDPHMLDVFKTGVQYQFYHTFAIIAVAILLKYFSDNSLLNYAGYLFLIGIILFSGSLYTMALTDITKLGIVTPFGGLCFLAGWALLFLSVWKMK